MNIAEIRKKARSVKDDVARRAEAPVPRSVAAPESLPPVTAVMPAVPVTVDPLKTTQHAAPQPDSWDLGLAAANPGSSAPGKHDALDELFNWSPDAQDMSIESYGARFASDSEKADIGSRQWLAFMLGEEEYSLDIVSIREIIKPREVTDIPRVPSFLLGIISLRGNIIPIFDLKRRLQLGESVSGADSRIIVCQDGERLAGLLVDRISQVVTMPERSIEPPPAVLSGIDRDLVGGVGRFQGKMMVLLHLPSVLNVELT